MKINFKFWSKKQVNKSENNRKQVELALYYLFYFRAKPGSDGTRLSSLRKVIKNRSVASEKHKSLFL